MNNAIIIKPMVTEKTSGLANTQKVFTFEVQSHASKHQVEHALERLYKVKVAGVRMVLRKGKIKRSGRKMISKKLPNKKIAYVSLKEGTFDFFPNS